MTGPQLTISTKIARSVQIVADQLVLGLVTGGFLGSGLVIERREARRIDFSRIKGLPRRLPDRGEIRLTEDPSGETQMDCQLWCFGMTIWRLLHAIAAGAVVATVGALLFGWLIVVSVPVGVGVALIWDIWGRLRDRTWLRRRVEAFVRNTNYLRSV
jgi:hypothetical protein